MRTRPGRRTAGLLTAILVGLAGTAVAAAPPAEAVPPPFNYGEALQKSIWFYEAQVSGTKPAWNRVSWRGDSFTGDVFGGVDLTGGFHDAGDHIKATFPMAHSMAVLAWGLLEWPSAYTGTGQRQHLLSNLRWGMDWLIRGHPSANRFVALVGDPSLDHRKWAAAEVQTYQRQAWFIDTSCPGADLAGSGAATFAAAAMVFQQTDPAYASTLLTHARQLYAFADQAPMSPYNPAFEYERCAPVGGIYESHSGYRDELVWGAIWLSRATSGTESANYLAKAEQYYDLLPRSGQGSTVPPYQWTLDWDDKAIASEVLLAKLTGANEYVTDVSRWADYTTDRVNGYNGQRATYSPGGQIFYLQWGSLRYAMGAAFLAFVAADSGRLDATRTQRLIDFAKRQVNYTLGDNPANLSYLVGFSKNGGAYVRRPHHRTEHGPWTDNFYEPVESRHTLYGALVGGPKTANDDYGAEDRNDFVKAEVALDFNAPYVGNLARMWLDHGGTPLASFPPTESPDGPEMYLEAGINQQGGQPGPFLEVKAFVRNKSAWPARHLTNGSFRYYFTIGAGVSPSQVQLTTAYNQCSTPTGPTLHSGNVYYVAVSCAGQQISPIGQSEWRREVQFRISFPAGSTHDFTTDWSYQGIGPDGTTLGLMPRMTLFDGSQLVWGTPPDSSSQSPSPSPSPSPGPSPSPSPSPSPAAGCQVAYSASDWGNGSGFTGSVTITNRGTAPISGWTLEFAFPAASQRVGQGWNAGWTQPAGSPNVTATDAGHNATIGPNGSVSIGFNGSYQGSNPEPAAFILNDLTCTIV